MNKFMQKFEDEMNLRGFSEETKYAYKLSMSKLMKYFKTKHPEKLTLDDIKSFFINTRKYNGEELSPNTINRHIMAINFFYINVLNRRNYREEIPRRKVKRSLPDYLSQQEILKMIEVLENIKLKAIFMTLYSTGIRLSELQNLKSSDIDSRRMVIRIRNGKGGKDREALLSENLLVVLRQYWKENNDDKSQFLFVASRNNFNPSQVGRQKLSKTGVGYAVKRAAKLAGVKKKYQLTL